MESVPEATHEEVMEKIEHEMNFKQLLSAMGQLNEIDKSIMLLYLEEHSYEEISRIVGISKANVGVRINRAKKQLKNYLINE